jgi:hypothetical protein
MESLTGMTNLRILDLRDTVVSDEGMAPLKKLSNLKSLDLSETLVGNAGLQHLKELKNLDDLNLWATRVGDAGMEHISAMKPLKRLNLDNVGFPGDDVALTDAGVKKLVSLTNLEFLHLGKTKITDEALTALAGLKKLKQLEVTHCDVTEQGIQKLKAALPEIEVKS